MALMEVVLEQEFFNQRTINRFNFVASGTPAAVSMSFALVSALGGIPSMAEYPADHFIFELANIQSDDVSFIQLTAKDVYDPEDFYQVPFIEPLSGQQAGTSMPPFASFGMRTNRTRLDIRRGTKRFVGVFTDQIDDGGNFDAGTLVLLAELSNLMADVLEYDDEGNTLSFAPCVVQKERYQVPDSDPARFAYRYFESESEQLEHVMTSIVWNPYPNVRTQASRQYGRGQ